MERFFELATPASADGQRRRLRRQITANSFMKREFGKKLIEEFFASQVDLTHVVDTSGAYIPGHGTPTVILVGRNRRSPGHSDRPGRPRHPRRTSAARRPCQGPRVAADRRARRPTRPRQSAWVSVADLDRDTLASHPWSLAAVGHADLKAQA